MSAHTYARVDEQNVVHSFQVEEQPNHQRRRVTVAMVKYTIAAVLTAAVLLTLLAITVTADRFTAADAAGSVGACSPALFYPLPANASQAAKDVLLKYGGPRPAGNNTREAMISNQKSASESARDHSAAYRRHFAANSSSGDLGGVATIFMTPKKGLAANGSKRANPNGVASGGGGGQGVILFFHGGGYREFHPEDLFMAFAPLAAVTGFNVAAPDYRLAPQHPYPAALDDAIASYKALLGSHNASQIALSGGSAGGGLAAALLLRAAAEGLPLPGAVVLLSPWAVLDPLLSDTQATLRCADPALSVDALRAAAEAYAGGESLTGPLLSPALGDWGAARRKAGGFPPVMIVASTREVLLSDSVRLHRAMRAGGIRSTLSVWEGMWHGWSTGYPGTMEVPEAAATTQEAGEFLRCHVITPGASRKGCGLY